MAIETTIDASQVKPRNAVTETGSHTVRVGSHYVQNLTGGVSKNESPVHDKEEQLNASTDALDSSVEEINKYVQTLHRNLQFSIDEDTGKNVIKVVDSETGTLIRQIPSEELIAISKALQENMDNLEGLMVHKKV